MQGLVELLILAAVIAMIYGDPQSESPWVLAVEEIHQMSSELVEGWYAGVHSEPARRDSITMGSMERSGEEHEDPARRTVQGTSHRRW